MATPKPQLRLSTELKKAVHSREEYEDMMTLVQFMVKERSEIALRLSRISAQLEIFVAAGGRIVNEDKSTTITFGDLTYSIRYNDDGDVCEYTVRNPSNTIGVDHVHRIFFCAYIRPWYLQKLQQIEEQLADIDNDNTLRGIAEIRKAIRGDKWLTISAISGTAVQSEEDVDPYGIFGDDSK